MTFPWRRAARRAAELGVTLLAGGFLAAALVRLAPGFGVDERELDPRLSADSIAALRQSRGADDGIGRFYVSYLRGWFHGDLGVSQSLGRPVSELLRDRVPVTLRLAGAGLLGGWALALLLALPGVVSRAATYDAAVAACSGFFLCLPAALLGVLCVWIGGPASAAVALVLFPKLFRYCRNALLEAARLPHVETAWAKGLGRMRILVGHILPGAIPQFLALLGVSVGMAFGAAIPMEVICDRPGIGQLAWQAALSRDLMVLVNVTVLATGATLAANFAADLGLAAWLGRRA